MSTTITTKPDLSYPIGKLSLAECNTSVTMESYFWAVQHSVAVPPAASRASTALLSSCLLAKPADLVMLVNKQRNDAQFGFRHVKPQLKNDEEKAVHIPGLAGLVGGGIGSPVCRRGIRDLLRERSPETIAGRAVGSAIPTYIR